MSQYKHQNASSSLTPNKFTSILGVMFNDQLSLPDHVLSLSQSCHFPLYSLKNRPYLSQYATQRLVHIMVISLHNYCSVHQANLPSLFWERGNRINHGNQELSTVTISSIYNKSSLIWRKRLHCLKEFSMNPSSY